MDTADRVRQFIKDNFYAASASDLTDDASLLDLGIVDSTGILEVVAFLEDEFQITVDDAEMLPENLDSIQN
ncbi:MAG TPA: acyl carrier protein, partial [Polyangiaceae bacterium]|nr:acyl carrier protein [Polyangiaceae bacterium]